MKTYLHVNSLCESALTVNGRFAGRAGADAYIHIESDGEDLLLCASPIGSGTVSGEKTLPCAALIQTGGGALITENPNVAVTKFPLNHYELTLTPETVYSSVPAAALRQERFTAHGGETHTVTLLQDAHKQLICEGGGKLFTHILPKTFMLKELSVAPQGRAALIKAWGTVGGEGGGEYLAVIAHDDGYTLNLNVLCDKAEFEDGKIQTLTRLYDIARRGVVVTYDVDPVAARYGISDHYAVYLYNGPVRPFNKALIPFAFFQAVKAGDFNEARYFLDPALNNDIDSDDALTGFFEDCDIIEENRYFPEIPCCAVIKSRHKKINAARLLKYSLDGDDKINDLKIL